MTAPEVELRAAWHQVAGDGHEQLLQALLARHREPHRRYHTATHVMWVLRHVSALLAQGEACTDPAAVRLAALYHDAVYAPAAPDNEARSAALAVQAATALGWSQARLQLVERLVLATAAHEPSDADEALLLDADLAILGAEPSDYTAYLHGIRGEYAHVPDGAWRAGRSAVLRGFLARPALFATGTMRREREARARANIATELAALAALSDPSS